MGQIGYLDIENDELQKYFDAVNKKVGICDILPRGRFSIIDNGKPVFSCLVCSDYMGGKQTGVAAGFCRNCTQDKQGANHG